MEKIFFDTLVHRYVEGCSDFKEIGIDDLGYYEDKDMDEYKEALKTYKEKLEDKDATAEDIQKARAELIDAYEKAHRY